MVSADSPPRRTTDDPTLIPPKPNRITQAGGTAPNPGRFAEGTSPAPVPMVSTLPTIPTPQSESPGALQNLKDLKALAAATGAAWRVIDTYETVAYRRELNPSGHINNEVVFVQYRREPMSVYTLNIGESGKGREMIYFPAKFDDKIHVKLGKGDPFPGLVAPAPISPDDQRVRAKARYSMREAGFGRPIAAFGEAVAQLEAGTIAGNALQYDGEVYREELPRPVIGVTHQLRPGDELQMPKGGTRLYFFDMTRGSPSYGMPILIVTTEPTGREVEYYRYEKMKQPANLSDANFDPARLKKKSDRDTGAVSK
jgi:hypothetical protein